MNNVDWALVNKAKNLAGDQLNQPILEVPIIRDYREPLLQFLRPGMKILDIGANDRSLKTYMNGHLGFAVIYKSMDIDRSHPHEFYSLEEINEEFDILTCFEVVEHLTPAIALDLFQRAYRLLRPKGRMFVSSPNVYHPMSFWSDCTHGHL